VSFALALRNAEGVLLATDSASTIYDLAGRREEVSRNKIRWFRNHRAACALFPVVTPSPFLVDYPGEIGELDLDADIAGKSRDLYGDHISTHFRNLGLLRDVDASWHAPHLVVAAYPSSGPVLLRIINGELEDDPGKSLAFFVLGAWGELGPCEPRLMAVQWKRADTMKRAKKIVGDVMLEYIADYEKAGSAAWASWGRTIGGPINIATITKSKITVETYGRKK
jgi:hypothetical protein